MAVDGGLQVEVNLPLICDFLAVPDDEVLLPTAARRLPHEVARGIANVHDVFATPGVESNLDLHVLPVGNKDLVVVVVGVHDECLAFRCEDSHKVDS